MKKTYQQPAMATIEMKTKSCMLAGSGYANSTDGVNVKINDTGALSAGESRQKSIWDEE